MSDAATAPRFTVLMPVNRPPALLRHAVGSVQQQRRQDFELFIVCDGPPRETVAAADDLARADPRIRVFDFPKGERHGEAWRHLALLQARGALVAHISDDDLWLPEHLGEVEALLAEADFGNLPQLHATPDGGYWLLFGSLADPGQRHALAEGQRNFFGPTFAAYRLDAYRALPEGWAPAPPFVPTDLHMWGKFLARPGLRAATRYAFTALHFATPERREWPLERREREMADWARRIAQPGSAERIRQAVLHHALVERQDPGLQRSLAEEALHRQSLEIALTGQRARVGALLARQQAQPLVRLRRLFRRRRASR